MKIYFVHFVHVILILITYLILFVFFTFIYNIINIIYIYYFSKLLHHNWIHVIANYLAFVSRWKYVKVQYHSNSEIKKLSTFITSIPFTLLIIKTRRYCQLIIPRFVSKLCNKNASPSEQQD